VDPRARRGRRTHLRCVATTAATGSGKLDLRGTAGGTGRLTSYQELLLGRPHHRPATGQPVTVLRNGVPEVRRGAPLVDTSSGSANTAGQARKSRLTEILWGQTLLAGSGARADHPDPPASAPDHARLLTRAEKRLLAEWMDVGGQYYNDPFRRGQRRAHGDRAQRGHLPARVQPVLQAQCAACHQAGLGNPRNRFVLTGSEEGDYNVTLSMVNDTCNSAANPLLARPSTCRTRPASTTADHGRAAGGQCRLHQIAAWIAPRLPHP
jgi:hypothetical protein